MMKYDHVPVLYQTKFVKLPTDRTYFCESIPYIVELTCTPSAIIASQYDSDEAHSLEFDIYLVTVGEQGRLNYEGNCMDSVQFSEDVGILMMYMDYNPDQVGMLVSYSELIVDMVCY